MLELSGLSKIYRSQETETIALNSVNLEVQKGEFVAVMGPSGCGKSTLLNLIGMLDKPTMGTYSFMGQDVTHLTEKQLGRIRKVHMGFIFQSFNLIEELTVEENIGLALQYRDISSRTKKRRVGDIMDQLGISHRAKHLPGQLSGGQQQVVAVARAVVGEQTVILADEPTGNLDSDHGGKVMAMLRDLNDAGVTIIMVTHSAAHADHARRTLNLFDGRIVAQSLRAVC